MFPEEYVQAPRSWTEKAYHHLIYFDQAEKGGHFAAWEQPQVFSEQLRAAFRTLPEASPVGSAILLEEAWESARRRESVAAGRHSRRRWSPGNQPFVKLLLQPGLQQADHIKTNLARAADDTAS